MERVQLGEATCVLVQDDGSYRLEKLFRAKTEMYTGSIGSAPIDQLHAMLANERFSKLSQDGIHQPLIGDTLDAVQLAIWRGQGWQELTFSSSESRKPFKEFMDPLLRWFQEIQKHRPASVRAEGAPTRCMPPPSTNKVVTTSPEPPGRSPVSPPASGYLFRISSSHFYKGRVDTTCTVVFGEGRFHRERGNQAYMGKRRDKIADGQLESEALQQLRDVLNSSELKDAPGGSDVGSERPLWMQEGTKMELAIPRESKVQNLSFLTALNTLGDPQEIGGKSNMGYHIADRKVLEPLLRWMKEHTDKQAHETETDGAGNDCYPTKTTAPSHKSAN